MIGSIKLLVATLGISQFSGVVEAKGNPREAREQLRRNLRNGSAATKAQTERKTQFVWNDFEDDAPPDVNDFEAGLGFEENQGDLFEPGDEVVESNIVDPIDDFFSYTEDGMVFDWDAAGHDHEHEHHDVDHTHEADYYGYEKTGKFSKALSSKSDSPKSGKIGKAMWEETPVVAKSTKGGKGKKSGKSAKGGVGVYYPSTYYESHSHSNDHDDHDDHDDYDHSKDHYHVDSHDDGHDHGDDHDEFFHSHGDDWLGGIESSSSLGYSDLFNHDTHVAATTDDYFTSGRMDTEPVARMSGSEVMARTDTFDDDFFTTPDTRLVFLPRPTVTVAGSIFSFNPQNVLAPVIPGDGIDSLTLGTEYLFNDLTFDAQNIISQYIPLQVDSTLVEFSVALDGTCTRIGPADANSVQGYCFFTYTFLDPMSQLVAGAFTAQGIIVNSSVPGQLTVSGGTGIMTGATGVVEILPAAIDSSVNPPMLVQPAEDADPFNEVAGWAHFFEFDVDVLFFLPELYQR